MGGQSKNRSHSTLTKLPDDLLAAVNTLLVEGTTYEDITKFLKARGQEISRSAVGRYAQDFLSKLERIRILEDQAKAVVAEGGTPMAMEEALSKLFTAEIMAKLLDGKLGSNMDLNFAIGSFARLQSSSVAREMMKKEFKKDAEKAVDNIKKTGIKKNIDPEFIRMVEEQVLGIVRP